ncbi:MAG: PQQ-binding-like beta-propeller repeat protein [Kiritimatiellaeota bacterium]|nr:PQQ-binding-like beta-propeller repeat protein [Kiritimatiellota bacterium]
MTMHVDPRTDLIRTFRLALVKFASSAPSLPFSRRRFPILCAASLTVVSCLTAPAADWPTFRHDSRRSGCSPEALDPTRLTVDWSWRSVHPPQPAWPGPARWDAYHNIRGLKSMRNYDAVFHPAIVRDSLWFASSADNTVYCLDTLSGGLRWRFTVDAAIRTTPTWDRDRVYFGADDGYAYCLDARTGRLLWRFSPKPAGKLVLHEGRPISFWPCRTTPAVRDGTVYFGMALFPWKKSYLCALDVATGRPDGPGRYVRELDGATFEGPLAASTARLVSPQGRVPPRLFDRATGAALGRLKFKKGGGGCFVLLTPGGEVFDGPGNKTGWIAQHSEATGERIAVFQGGAALVVVGGKAYLLSDNALTAMDKKTRKSLWRTPCDCPLELVYAGGVLFAGGQGRVLAFDARSGAILWRGRVRGRAYGLAVANGALYVSTDAGILYRFTASKKPLAAYADLLHGDEAPPAPGAPLGSDAPPADPALFGRWVFRHDRLRNGVARDSTGRHAGKVLGNVDVVRVGKREALRLDGSTTSVRVADDASKVGLPVEALTVTAWVRVDRETKWGGIVGAFQDNGNYERGWVLGYNGRNFSFALKAANGPGRLTYLGARESFSLERWYFVAGAYDGTNLRIFVNGRLAAESADQKGPIDYPPQSFLEIGAYHDKDEYNRLPGLIHEVRIYARALTPQEILDQYKEKADGWPQPPPPAPRKPVLELALGPWVEYIGRTSAVVRWFSPAPMASTLVVSAGNRERRIRENSPSRFHEVLLEGLDGGRIHDYSIEAAVNGVVRAAGPYQLDTSCNYTLPEAPPDLTVEMEAGSRPAAAARLAREILDVGRRSRGLCFVLGVGDGRLLTALIRRSNFRIIGLDTDATRVTSARKRLVRAGVYGVRATVLRIASATRLPFNGLIGNLVVVRRPEFFRAGKKLVEPYGVLLAGTLRNSPSDAMGGGLLPADGTRFAGIPENAEQVEGGLARWRRWECPALPDSGEWTHEYGRADNSAFGGESLRGAVSTRQFAVQWLGRPGPRARPDRNGRMSSPLAVAGRLFSPGLNRMIALDAYNGAVLWSLEIPGFLRCNIPHDSSNWCVDAAHVYAAVRDKCWRITAADGVVDKFFDVQPGARKGWKWEWSYIARPEKSRLLIGSAAKAGSSFKDFWGDFGWYDAKNGPQTAKVASDNLFALDPDTGRQVWVYAERSVVLNCTITVADDRIWFVVCRNPKVVQADTRRCATPELWKDRSLVCLDLKTGRRLWEKPLRTAPGTVVFFLAAGSGRLVLLASDKKYHVYGFEAETGKALWNVEFDWPKDNHGGHMSRPAIVGNRVYVRPRVIDLNTGKVSDKPMPLGACGTYSFSAYAGFYRFDGRVSIWDVTRDKPESWARLRPDCWLSTIPACGMLLSPEGGGGCSCGAWMETSLGFLPVGNAK